MALFDLTHQSALAIEHELHYLTKTFNVRSWLCPRLDPRAWDRYRLKTRNIHQLFQKHRIAFLIECKNPAKLSKLRKGPDAIGSSKNLRPGFQQVVPGSTPWKTVRVHDSKPSYLSHWPAIMTGNSLPRPSTVSVATKGESACAFHHGRRSYSSGLNACSVAERVEKDKGNGLQEHLSESIHTNRISGTTSSTCSDQTQPTITEEAPVQTNPVPPAPKFWSHRMHQSPDGKDIVIHYCRTLQSTEEVARYFLDDEVVGFDMEWKAQASGSDSIQNNLSLIQIANKQRIALFHIALFKPATELDHLVAPSLRQIMESPGITKVGVSIKADCTRLRKYLGINPRAIFELSHLHKLVKYCQTTPKLINKRLVNLSEQVEQHFGLPMDKGEDVRCSDWGRPLKYNQVQYAASDPYACIRLFHAMDDKRKAIDPAPPRPAHAELDLPIRLAEKKVIVEEKENVAVDEDEEKVVADEPEVATATETGLDPAIDGNPT